MRIFSLGILIIGFINTVIGSQKGIEDILNSLNVSCQSNLTEKGIYGCFDTSLLPNGTLLPIVQGLLDKEKLLYDIIGNTTNVTKENVLMPLLTFKCLTHPIYKSLAFLSGVASDPTLRNASHQAKELMQKTNQMLRLHQGVFHNLVVLSKNTSNLTTEELRFVSIFIMDSLQLGLNSTNETKHNIQSDLMELEKLSKNFSATIQANRDTIQFNRSSLRGVYKGFIDRHLVTNQSYYSFSFLPHDYKGVFEHCEVEETRKQMFRGYSNRGGQSNIEIIKKVLEVRANVSRSLGYENYVDLVTEGMVARNHTNVKKFLDDLHSRLIPGYTNESTEFLKLKARQCWQNESCTNATQIWDFPFLINTMKREIFSVDEHKVKEYFPLGHVLNATLVIFGQLLGLKFTSVNLTLWSKDVISYHVTETESGEDMGFILMDLMSRQDKTRKDHVTPLQASCMGRNGSRQVPVAAVIMNYKNSGGAQQPLLTFRELETLYRMLGNAFYAVSSKTNISTFTIDSVEGDFMKAPSRMMDYWLREPTILGNISSHYQNKTRISEALMDNITKSHEVGFAVETLKQVMLALYDQFIHVNGTTDPNASFIEFAKSVLNFTIPSDIMFPSIFVHLVTSHGGKYYSYFWSQIYSADMFLSQFKKHGILNATVGEAFRHQILEKGASEDALDLLRDFLGRDPTTDAFLKINNLN